MIEKGGVGGAMKFRPTLTPRLASPEGWALMCGF